VNKSTKNLLYLINLMRIFLPLRYSDIFTLIERSFLFLIRLLNRYGMATVLPYQVRQSLAHAFGENDVKISTLKQLKLNWECLD